MRIKLNGNLPVALSSRMRELGHEADTAAEEGMAGPDDETLWRAAQADGRFFITQDLGFSDARKYSAGSHFGILVLRLGDLRMIEIVERVGALPNGVRAAMGPVLRRCDSIESSRHQAAVA